MVDGGPLSRAAPRPLNVRQLAACGGSPGGARWASPPPRSPDPRALADTTRARGVPEG